MTASDVTHVDHGGASRSAAVTREVVRAFRRHAGRGPTKGRTSFSHDVCVVVLEEVMTPLEQSAVAHGGGDTVRELRRHVQAAMRHDLAGAVARLSERHVAAVMGDLEPDANMAIVVFVFERLLDPGTDGGSQDAAVHAGDLAEQLTRHGRGTPS